jgi:diketogulonate reductase-like aldo/keto reductase
MSSGRKFHLNNGAPIPAVGFGTWKSAPEDAYKSVLEALNTGYRHIDAAWVRDKLGLARVLADT